RSEGFGLTMAEAMLHERPVIASGYGGNLEFMDGDGAHLVDVAPATVTDRSRYPEGGTWAEPDLDHAAALMRSVVEDPDTARKRSAAGADALRRRHSPAAVGAVLAEHIERGRASVADRPPLPV